MFQVLTILVAASPFAPEPLAVDELMLASLDTPSLGMLAQDPVAGESADAVADESVPGFGQDVSWTSGTRLSLQVQYAHLFNTTVDNDAGEFDADQLRLRVNGRTAITDSFDLTYGFRYEYDGFNFAGHGFFGDQQPWTDIHTVQFSVGGLLEIDDHWQAFAGGVFRFARETGADWGDGFEGGGAFGVSYSFNDSLTLGGGLGIITQVEDGLLYYPIVVADWKIIDRLVLTTRISTGWANESGVELVYDWTDHWDVGVGASYDYQRFRLNDDGPVPGGAGKFTALPFYGFVNWEPMPSFNASLYVGLNTMGEVEAINSNGSVTASENYGIGFVLGAQGTISF